MLHQVVGSVFMLMREYETIWRRVSGSRPVEVFGFRFDVGLDPIEVNVEPMLGAFRSGCQELAEVWSLALERDTYEGIRRLGRDAAEARSFHMEDDLWVRVVMDFACAYNCKRLAAGHLLKSITPLYLARVASFVVETRDMVSAEVEDRIEQLCLAFEARKPYLVSHWTGEGASQTPESGLRAPEARERTGVEA
jgi:hypothetical protein